MYQKNRIMQQLIVFNKPYGVITQFSPHEKHLTLKSYDFPSGFYPAGRLDTDSEGMLLLTNNGKLQARIAEPKYKLNKTYWAQVEGIPDENALKMLEQGAKLKDFVTAPAKVSVLQEPTQLWARVPPIRERKSIPTTWLSIGISEGKNRQVRRMCAHIGFPCLRLVRVGMGALDLMALDLPCGQWRYIDSTSLFA